MRFGKSSWYVSTAKAFMAVIALGASSAAVSAQTCSPEFASGFEYPGVQGYINASVMYDAGDGNGPRLVVGGSFYRAGGKVCNSLAMFDGTNWQPLGLGVTNASSATAFNATVTALAVVDKGDGHPDLIVGGSGTIKFAKSASGANTTITGNLARWNGFSQSWANIPLTGGVYQIFALLDDNQVGGPNPGPRFYVGYSNNAGSSPYLTAFRWTGSAYSQVFIGGDTTVSPATGNCDNIVTTLAKFNGRVYLGGAFTDKLCAMNSDGSAYQKTATPVPSDLNVVYRMAVYNGRLFCGGDAGVQSYDGASSWQSETFGQTDITFTFTTGNPNGFMRTIDLGTGPKLYMGGLYFGYHTSDGSPSPFIHGAVWNGSVLSPIGAGFLAQTIIDGVPANSTDVAINTAVGMTLRGTPVVFFGGNGGVSGAGGLVGGANPDGSKVLSPTSLFYDGTKFLPQYTTTVNGGYSSVQSLKIDGVNQRLVSNGAALLTDVAHPNSIAVYNGTQWLGSGIPVPNINGYYLSNPRYIRYDDGTGEALFAYGANIFNGVADSIALMKLSGSTWSYVGAQSPFPFSNTYSGNIPFNGAPAGAPTSAIVFDTDGDGPERPWLIIAGNTISTETYFAQPSLFAWDGSAWRTLGDGLADTFSSFETGDQPNDVSRINSLAVYNEGSGAKLYVGGGFLIGGSGPTWAVARYDGTGSTGTWTGLGQTTGGFSTSNNVRTIDIGSGPQLFAFGAFTDMTNPNTGNSNPSSSSAIAVWDPATTTWSGFESSLSSGAVNDVVGFNDGSGGGSALFALGSFANIGGTPAAGIAKFSSSSWAALGGGLNSFQTNPSNGNRTLNPFSLMIFDDDGSGPSSAALYIAGNFDNANGKYTQSLARYGCPKVICKADFDNNNVVNVSDIFAFLRAWFAHNISADIDGNSVVNVSDIFAFLRLWFARC